MDEASNFGEIRELLERGWSEFRLPQLRELIREALRVRDSETRALESRSSVRIGRALTILFGLIAAPAVSTQVLRPLWRFLAIAHPKSEDLFTLSAVTVSFILVTLLVAFLMVWLRPQDPKD